MIKKNKSKGFTIVELIVSFVLVSMIAIVLFNCIISLKNLFVSAGTKTQILNKQSLMSNKINEALANKELLAVTKCGSYCLNFVFTDGLQQRLVIDTTNNTFQYDNYKVKLNEGSTFGDMKIDVTLNKTFNEENNDAFITIDIPIYNRLFENVNYGINIVHQYNSKQTQITNILFDSENTESNYILVIGNKSVKRFNNISYIDDGFILYDFNGNIVADTSSVVITNPFTGMTLPYKNGNYQIKYEILNDGNVVTSAIRNVEIIDGAEIRLTGDNPYNIIVGNRYIEPGYKLYDTLNNEIDSSNYIMNISNNINTAVAGTYQVTYIATYNGNTISTTRTVNVNEPS